MKTELRLTDTNAASDSKGRTWGLEGDLFWWLVGGVGAGITLFFVFLVVLKSSLLTSFGVAVVPVLLCLAYIFGLRQGKPPGYDRDFFEHCAHQAAAFAPGAAEPSATSSHPLSLREGVSHEQSTSLNNSTTPNRRCAKICTATTLTRPPRAHGAGLDARPRGLHRDQRNWQGTLGPTARRLTWRRLNRLLEKVRHREPAGIVTHKPIRI